MKKKILYVEDEPFLGRIVKETLEGQNFEVNLIHDGALVMESFKTFLPDICVLDVMLPNVDGFSLGQEIRTKYPHLPILFVTAKTSTDDVLQGFESGGTEYIRKPFSMKELIVRINNQLNILNMSNKKEQNESDVLKLGKYSFNRVKYELIFKDQIKKLSYKEAEILTILASNCNNITERKHLLLNVWGDDSYYNSRTLDVYIRKLRDCLSEDKSIEIITLKGKGYHFLVP